MVKESSPWILGLLAVPFLFNASPRLWSDQTATLPAEASSSLFSVELGSMDAELDVKGSWEASLVGQTALEFSSEGVGFSSIQPFLLTQTPDLSLEFLLFKKFFVEARVADDITQARYSFGYRGGEEETLKEVRAGNDGISFPELPFLSFGEGSYRSFGLAAKAATADFEGRAMIRYDQATRATKTFSGGAEVTDTVIGPQEFVRGRWFNVPADASNLVLYAKSASGGYAGSDGNNYRKLESGEYAFTSSTGFIALSRASETSVVAAYDGSAGSVTIAGSSCLILYDPDTLTDPFNQVLCRYTTTADPDDSEAFVRDATSGLKDSTYEVAIDSAGYAEVTQTGTAATPLNASYALPFKSDADTAGLNWIYVTDLSDDGDFTYAPVATREIVVRSRSSVDSMTIDEDYIPGSVEVTRDAAPEYAFEVDADLHTVTLATPAGQYETIVVSYLRESSERKSGSLAAGLGGIWTLGEGRSAWTALGLRWSLPGVSYATADASNSGSITLTAGERDAEGSFQQRLALGASYTNEETSGRYRIEGMESSGSYDTSFRPTSSVTINESSFSALETTDSLLKARFPTLVSALHSDGTSQKALELSDSASDWGAELVKVVTTPTYSSFGTFSFFAMTSAASGTLTLALDEGTGATNKAVEVEVPLSAFDGELGKWRRIVVKYGDLNIYVQDQEEGSLSPIATLSTAFDASSTAARVRIRVEGAAAGQSVWIDEICLEDSVGNAALLVQGELSYKGLGYAPLISGIAIAADLSAALHEESYASGGASISTSLGPLGVSLKGRGSATASGSTSMSAGHELSFPAQSFPLRATDLFEFDPSTGAFGKKDGITAQAGSLASLALKQLTSWTPASSLVLGILSQEWDGDLSAAGGRLSLGAKVVNRSRPSGGPGLTGADYGTAWIDSFAYLLPSFEASSDRRKESLSLAAKLSPSSEFLSASVEALSEPDDSDGGTRDNTASARIGIPLTLGRLSFVPYYKRVWSDERNGTGSGIVSDIDLAVSDFSGLSPLYSLAPFREFVDPSVLKEFTDATAASSLSEAAYAPEAGFALNREFGSYWYDLVAPASFSFAFRRLLERDGDTVTDTAVWEASSKSAAINLFGKMGAYPAASIFDSDEYHATIKGNVKYVSGESAPRINLQTQHLASFLSGDYDRLDAENRVYVNIIPSKTEWYETLSLERTMRVQRSWLLDLYRLALPKALAASIKSDAAAGASTDAGDGKKLSFISKYFEDIAAKDPVARTTFGLKVKVENEVTDDAAPDPSWSVEESYVAKVTVPERLTIVAKSDLTQTMDGDEKVFSFGGSITLGLTISF